MKKIRYVFVLLLAFIFNINIAYAGTPVTYDRSDSDNYLVNKKWKVNSNNLNNVLNTPAVNAGDKVYDFSDILTDSEEEMLASRIQSLVGKMGYDIVILTNSVPYYSDYTNEEYATDFYDYNDFGIDFEHYDGVILFRNTYASDPYYGMYCFGNAQLMYNSSRIDTILDNIYYSIHYGNYYNGFSEFLDYIESYYNQGMSYEDSFYYIDDNGDMQIDRVGYYKAYILVPCLGYSILIGLIVAGIVISVMVSKNKMVKKATDANEYLDKNTINMNLLKDTYLRSHTTSYTVSSSSGGGGGGHSGGHSSSHGSSGGGHSGGGRHG